MTRVTAGLARHANELVLLASLPLLCSDEGYYCSPVLCCFGFCRHSCFALGMLIASLTHSALRAHFPFDSGLRRSQLPSWRALTNLVSLLASSAGFMITVRKILRLSSFLTSFTAHQKDRSDGLSVWNNEQVFTNPPSAVFKLSDVSLQYFASRYFDHNTNKQYDIFYQQGTVNCFSHAINSKRSIYSCLFPTQLLFS